MTNTRKTEILNSVKEKFGFVPNIIDAMANNPAVAKVYLEGTGMLEGGVLSAAERQVVAITISKLNGCKYCVAAHSTMAESLLDDEVVTAITQGNAPQDAKLAAIWEATTLIFKKRGWLSDEELESFKSRGLAKEQLFEVIAMIGFKTISNYINHINKTEIDQPFEAKAKHGEQCCGGAAQSCH